MAVCISLPFSLLWPPHLCALLALGMGGCAACVAVAAAAVRLHSGLGVAHVECVLSSSLRMCACVCVSDFRCFLVSRRCCRLAFRLRLRCLFVNFRSTFLRSLHTHTRAHARTLWQANRQRLQKLQRRRRRCLCGCCCSLCCCRRGVMAIWPLRQ